MQYCAVMAVAARVLWPRPGTSQRRTWHWSRPWDNRPANGTYLDGVTASPQPPSVARARFAKFVSRALDSARERGMTDKDIAAATGVGPSTFHRWRRAAGRELPEIEKVRAFCDGLGVSMVGAMVALGMSPGRDNAEPEPPMPPEMRVILRRLADPNVRDSDKLVIREMLKLLAAQANGPRRSQESGEEVTG